MSTSVNHLDERTRDSADLLEEIMPSAITLAMMLRHRKIAAWLRTEFDGYQDLAAAPRTADSYTGTSLPSLPQYGWIPAPVDDQQKEEFGYMDLLEGVKALEKICVNCKKGNGNQVLLEKDEMAVLQKQINLTAELAINLSRDVYCRLLRTVRAAIYLWAQELMAEGIAGEHNHYSPDEREKVAHLDEPEMFWRRAMEEVDSLPIPNVREVGFFERVFGRAG